MKQFYSLLFNASDFAFKPAAGRGAQLGNLDRRGGQWARLIFSQRPGLAFGLFTISAWAFVTAVDAASRSAAPPGGFDSPVTMVFSELPPGPAPPDVNRPANVGFDKGVIAARDRRGI